MGEVEGDRDAGRRVGAEPFVGKPVVRADSDGVLLQFVVKALQAALKPGALDADPEVLEAQLEKLFVGQGSPGKLARHGSNARFRPKRCCHAEPAWATGARHFRFATRWRGVGFHSMNRLAGAFILAALALPSSPGRAGTGASTAPIDVDTAIVFAADISWSMDARELRVVREGHAEAITAPEVLDAISRGAIGRVAVTYIEFAGAARQMVDWMVIDGRPSAERFAAAIRAIEGATEPYTDISAAFYLADNLFAAMPYRATNKVVDVVGDGDQWPDDVAEGNARGAGWARRRHQRHAARHSSKRTERCSALRADRRWRRWRVRASGHAHRGDANGHAPQDRTRAVLRQLAGRLGGRPGGAAGDPSVR